MLQAALTYCNDAIHKTTCRRTGEEQTPLTLSTSQPLPFSCLEQARVTRRLSRPRLRPPIDQAA